MSIASVNRQYTNLVNQIGQAAFRGRSPHDFEYYMVALELTDGSGNTIDYFAFPILPSSIQKTEPKRTNIKQSNTGITVLSSTAFTPQQITLKGNFGRFFKIILQTKGPVGSAVAYSTSNGVYDLYQAKSKSLVVSYPNFDVGVKSGYGAINLLRAIIAKSNGVDDQGLPFRLYFYNMALGESFLVTVPASGLTLDTNAGESNTMWNYSLTLTAIAPLSLVLSKEAYKGSLKNTLKTGTIQKGANVLANSLNSLLQKWATDALP